MALTRCLLALAVGALLGLGHGCRRDGPAVVVYTSVDDVFARPALEAFQAESGIEVLAVYDVESTKTTGLYHRIIAERERPRADIFWISEVSRAVALERDGLLEPLPPALAGDPPSRLVSPRGGWIGSGLRARVLVYNRDLVPDAERPVSIGDLGAPRFRGKAAMAQPLFGTTATHLGALRSRIGKEAFEGFVSTLLENEVRILDGNSVVRDRVASGEVAVGLTDTDDALVALRKGLPLGIVFPDQQAGFPGVDGPLGAFLVPSAVCRIRGGPNPDAARRLAEFLLRRDTEDGLVQAGFYILSGKADGARSAEIPIPDPLVEMVVAPDDIARGLEESRDLLRRAFVR